MQFLRGDIKKWSSLSKEISIGGEDSSTGSSLAKSAKGGVGFHHAGLTNRQRKAIERSFKNGDIKCIVATPTLAQGVNLPARRVVIRDFRRWSLAASASMPLSVMEVRQMLGRAGGLSMTIMVTLGSSPRTLTRRRGLSIYICVASLRKSHQN